MAGAQPGWRDHPQSSRLLSGRDQPGGETDLRIGHRGIIVGARESYRGPQLAQVLGGTNRDGDRPAAGGCRLQIKHGGQAAQADRGPNGQGCLGPVAIQRPSGAGLDKEAYGIAVTVETLEIGGRVGTGAPSADHWRGVSQLASGGLIADVDRALRFGDFQPWAESHLQGTGLIGAAWRRGRW